MSNKDSKPTLFEKLGESQVWKSIFRSGVPRLDVKECMQF